MKKHLFIIAAICMILTSCGKTENSTENVFQKGTGKEIKTSDITETELAKAEKVSDLSDGMTRTSDFLKYSECSDDDELLFYFDILSLSGNNYITVEHSGSEYLLFMYCYSDYGVIMENVNSINKHSDGNTLNLMIDKDTHTLKRHEMYCEPDFSYCRCIVKLDKQYDNVVIDDKSYEKYDGGVINVDKKYGIIDENLNIIVPVIYNQIRNYDIYTYKGVKYETEHQYYRITGVDGNGIMDENYNIIVSPVYSNIYFINDDKFVVMKGKGQTNGIEDYQIGIVDGNGNITHDFIEGFINGSETNFTQNYAGQMIFGRMDGKDYLKGVLDENLNIVIEPVYKDVTVWNTDTENQFYVVENHNEEFAVIDTKGVQKTEFEKSSVYDVQTEYHEKLRNGDKNPYEKK